jgi:hypothetical protein
MSHQEQDSSVSESFISELSKDKSFPLLFPSILSIESPNHECLKGDEEIGRTTTKWLD